MTPTPPTRRQIDEMTAYQEQQKRCTCLTCWPRDFLDESSQFFRVCPTCGNKRCPKTTDHRHACTNSNEAGQVGSVYGKPAPSAGTCITPSQGESQHGQ